MLFLALVVMIINIGIYYVVIPYGLMHVLQFFGVDINFWLCVLIMLIFYVITGAFRRG